MLLPLIRECEGLKGGRIDELITVCIGLVHQSNNACSATSLIRLCGRLGSLESWHIDRHGDTNVVAIRFAIDNGSTGCEE